MKFIKLTLNNPNCNDRWVNIEYIQVIYEITKYKSDERLYTVVTLLGGDEDFCGHRSVIWDADFSYEDYGLEGDGIVHVCTCTHCGASIIYMIPAPPIIEVNEKNAKPVY